MCEGCHRLFSIDAYKSRRDPISTIYIDNSCAIISTQNNRWCEKTGLKDIRLNQNQIICNTKN